MTRRRAHALPSMPKPLTVIESITEIRPQLGNPAVLFGHRQSATDL
jgi:hypothetical protein